MSDRDRLDEIERRSQAATAGPWSNCGGTATHAICAKPMRIVGCDVDCYSPDVAVRGFEADNWRGRLGREGNVTVSRAGVLQYADAQFIAHAREDIPWLIEQIRALQKGDQQ